MVIGTVASFLRSCTTTCIFHRLKMLNAFLIKGSKANDCHECLLWFLFEDIAHLTVYWKAALTSRPTHLKQKTVEDHPWRLRHQLFSSQWAVRNSGSNILYQLPTQTYKPGVALHRGTWKRQKKYMLQKETFTLAGGQNPCN